MTESPGYDCGVCGAYTHGRNDCGVCGDGYRNITEDEGLKADAEMVEAKRYCRGTDCNTELTDQDPTRGRYANLCAACRRLAADSSRDRRTGRYSPRLTDADMQLLFAIAEGQFPIDIAVEHGITRTAVARHLAAVRLKLDAKTDAHLVALAYHRGILIAPKKR